MGFSGLTQAKHIPVGDTLLPTRRGAQTTSISLKMISPTHCRHSYGKTRNETLPKWPHPHTAKTCLGTVQLLQTCLRYRGIYGLATNLAS